MKEFSQKKQLEYAESIRLAVNGDLCFEWLNRIIEAVGFVRIHGSVESGSLFLVQAGVLARGLGVTKKTIQNWQKDGLPVYRVSVGNKPALYNVWDIVKWRIEKQAPVVDGSEDDPFLKGAPSPALEAYRREKAREAKRNNELAEGKLIDAAQIGIELTEIGRVFKARAEAIERAHGQVVGNAIREMIDAAQEAWEKLKGENVNA